VLLGGPRNLSRAASRVASQFMSRAGGLISGDVLGGIGLGFLSNMRMAAQRVETRVPGGKSTAGGAHNLPVSWEELPVRGGCE